MDKNRRMRLNVIRGMLILAAAVLLTACLETKSPSAAVEGYLQALADKDESAAVNLSCADWEEQAMAEGASFKSVEVALEDISCSVDSESGERAVVSCTGKYVFSYDAGEQQELNLEGRMFNVVKEAGEWRMCGYQQ